MPTRQILVLMLASALPLFSCGDAGRLDSACNANSDCTTDELCAAGFCGGFGLCITRPESCDDTVFDPVCGCDGFTYQSSCFAELAGVRLASADSGCSCADNTECQAGQFCSLDDSCSNVGACLPTPESCDPADTQEVCGCDGTTYANECTAFQSGARVSALGACSCEANADCAQSEYCNAIVCDGPGACEARNAMCEPDGSVTGCDGVVYADACEAATQGVRVRP